ncbi:hypothetical protein [Ramlibacter sp. AN1133]|uniref:hypothetical protein n=1 Tax=Ramlibacter sp. AN1133 TaxID=3133429 RepID=UPI0030C368AF
MADTAAPATPGPDARKLEILQHTLGLDEYGRRRIDRNHFVTGPGGIDHPHCMALVRAGLMTRAPGNPLTGGSDLFQATKDGRAYAAEHSPSPPRLTRSQRRYQEFLDADSGLSFREWLQADASTRRSLADPSTCEQPGRERCR